ncbi:hypothetical protein [Kineococcus sp. NUM-3379]
MDDLAIPVVLFVVSVVLIGTYRLVVGPRAPRGAHRADRTHPAQRSARGASTWSGSDGGTASWSGGDGGGNCGGGGDGGGGGS